MASFAPIRGSRTDIGNTSIVDGQFLVETDTSSPQDNRIYLDVGSDRIIVGGNANYIFVDANEGVISGTATTEANGVTVTFTNAAISSADRFEVYSEQYTSAAGTTPTTGTSANPLKALMYKNLYVSSNTVTVNVTDVPNGTYYKFSLKVYI